MKTIKKCVRCGEEKPREDFHKKRAASDGLSSWCKPCKVTKDVERLRLKRASMTPEEAALLAKKKAAHGKLDRAVRRGEVIKPKKCSKCRSKTTSREMHGHHHDYDKPLDVEWICRTCHLLDHAERVTLPCEQCGKSFGQARARERRFCSDQCWHQFMKERPVSDRKPGPVTL